MISRAGITYVLVRKGLDVSKGYTGPFSCLETVVDWVDGSGISAENLDLYRCEDWEDGSRDWFLESLDEAFDFVGLDDVG